jgi:hypothetical protein
MTDTPTDAPDTLFDGYDSAQPPTLAERLVVPPFSTLDRRAGYWQQRRRRWLALGLDSGEGRDDDLTYGGLDSLAGNDDFGSYAALSQQGTSLFDPVLTEIALRWWTAPGDVVYDPFAGGVVRGLVASHLRRRYIGLDLRPEQVAANMGQMGLCGDTPPLWLVGDAVVGPDVPAGEVFDHVHTCPPYADLEVYSSDPQDLSNMPYGTFLFWYGEAIANAVDRLLPDRFATWVVSDLRSPQGHYRGLVCDTIDAFRRAGCHLYNDLVIIDPVGTGAVRAGGTFTHRKVVRLHQHLLVFVKGSARAAAAHAATSGEWVPADG